MNKAVLLFLLSFALYGKSIGSIIKIKGEVEVIRVNEINSSKMDTLPVVLNKNVDIFPLFIDDKVITKKGALSIIEFNDKTVVNLGSKTDFIINDYFYEENSTKALSSFSVPFGVFKVITGKVGKLNPRKFKLKTKTAAIGIRGTEFMGAILRTKELISCIDGVITTTAAGVTVEVKAGFITEIIDGGAPSKPREYLPNELSTFTTLVTSQVPENNESKKKLYKYWD